MRTVLLFSTLVLVASSHSSTIAHAISFDCSKASSTVEKLICNDPLLGKLDDVMSQNYKNMLLAGIGEGARKDLKTTQRTWVSDRNKCTTASCLADAYRKRIDEVCEYPVIEGVHPECTYSADIS